MAADAGATVAGSYVVPARRSFIFLEDLTWAATTPAGRNLFDRALFWTGNFSAPAITQQSISQAVCTGAAVTLSVTVSGTGPFSYVWRRNGQAVPGAARRMYSIPSAAAASAGTYDVVVTGVAGTATSAPIVLTVGCPCGAADLGGPGGLTGFDGRLDNNDFIAFINLFFNGNPAADVGIAGGVQGSDGRYDNNDFIAFINLFFAGCP
ncbi:MAG: GC-type dockerin domain-anchored protein [Phycisphaerales bacterium]